MELKILLLVTFLLGINYGFSIDCPPDEYISPCKCYIPGYNFWCQNIYDIEVLRRVAENMRGMEISFQKFFLVNSTMMYVPTELLEIVKVKELIFENVTLSRIFLEPPTSLDIFERIKFENVKLLGGIRWSLLSGMKNLNSIIIYDTRMDALKKDFAENVPHTLKNLQFARTNMKKIEKEALQKLTDLQTLVIASGKLQVLQRDYFPVPFTVETINLADNKIQTIPDDLFTNMPNLKDLILADNQIATIPESAFGGNYNQLERLLLRGNPLKCECSMKWMVETKPEYLDGTCVYPKVMHGRELKDLTPREIFC